MLSGRLWSHDHLAVAAAAMNHYIVEPALARGGEERRKGGGSRESRGNEEGRDSREGGVGGWDDAWKENMWSCNDDTSINNLS